MGLLGSETFESMRDLLEHHLQDLNDAETRLLDAFGDLKQKASEPRLAALFGEQKQQAAADRERIEAALAGLGLEAERETCPAMKGLIKEAQEMVDATGDDQVIDAALIQSAQRLLHYKIAGYGSVRCQLAAEGEDDLARLMQKSLDDAKSADERLAELATEVVNSRAAAA